MESEFGWLNEPNSLRFMIYDFRFKKNYIVNYIVSNRLIEHKENPATNFISAGYKGCSCLFFSTYALCISERFGSGP